MYQYKLLSSSSSRSSLYLPALKSPGGSIMAILSEEAKDLLLTVIVGQPL